MSYILDAEAVRFDSQIMFRRKCDRCGEYYFFQLEETKSDKCCVCDYCKPIKSKKAEKSVVGGVKIIKGRTVAVKSYDIARRSKKNYKRVFQRDNFICQYCMRDGDTIDHINPVSNVGGNRMENLVCCCETCNSIAYNKLFAGFYDKMNYILAKRQEKQQ